MTDPASDPAEPHWQPKDVPHDVHPMAVLARTLGIGGSLIAIVGWLGALQIYVVTAIVCAVGIWVARVAQERIEESRGRYEGVEVARNAALWSTFGLTLSALVPVLITVLRR